MAEGLEIIAPLDNETQARLLDAILTERGVPHVMCCYYSTAYDGLFQMGGGWGHIEAPGSCRQEILAVLDDIEDGASNGLLPDDVEDDSCSIDEVEGQGLINEELLLRVRQGAIAGAACALGAFLGGVAVWLRRGISWYSYVVTEPHLAGVLGLRLCWGVILSVAITAFLRTSRTRVLCEVSAVTGFAAGSLATLTLVNLASSHYRYRHYSFDGAVREIAVASLVIAVVACVVVLKLLRKPDRVGDEAEGPEHEAP